MWIESKNGFINVSRVNNILKDDDGKDYSIIYYFDDVSSQENFSSREYRDDRYKELKKILIGEK